MKPINVAIIGCGRVAGNHLSAIKATPDMKLVAVCDLVKERTKNLIGQEDVPIYTNYYEMLMQHPQVDIVAIITPSGMHYEHAMDIIKNFRKHVVIEKPTILKLSHGRSLKEAALKYGVCVFPVFQYRFNKAVQRVKQAIISGELGDIFLATVRLRWARPESYYNRDPWRGTYALDGGACTNQGIHHLDLLRYLAGEINRVNCTMSTFGAPIEVEDTVIATLEFENKALGSLEITTAARPFDYESSISVLGSKGLAIIGGSSTGKLIQFSPAPKEEHLYSEDFPNPYGFGHKEIYAGVYNCLRRNGRPVVELDDAIKSINLLHALYKSNQIKGWVKVKDKKEFSRLGETDEKLVKIYRTPKTTAFIKKSKG